MWAVASGCGPCQRGDGRRRRAAAMGGGGGDGGGAAGGQADETGQESIREEAERARVHHEQAVRAGPSPHPHLEEAVEPGQERLGAVVGVQDDRHAVELRQRSHVQRAAHQGPSSHCEEYVIHRALHPPSQIKCHRVTCSSQWEYVIHRVFSPGVLKYNGIL